MKSQPSFFLWRFLFFSEWRAPFLFFFMAFVFFVIFYIDYTWKVGGGDKANIIGRVIYKNNVVKRKGKGDPVWSVISTNSPLHSKDFINTDVLSDAQIYLNDGTKIKIEEGSMFRLDFSGEKTSLSFRSGSLRIEQSGKKTNSLVVNTGGKQIVLDQANAKIVTSDEKVGEKGGIKLSVEKGEANISETLRDATGIQKKYRVRSQESAQLTSNDIVIRKIPILLLEPSDQEILTTESPKKQIQFSWKTQKKIRDTQVEMSRSRNFRKKIFLSPTDATKRKFLFSPGTYYWRVRGKYASGKKVFSDGYKFRLVQQEKLRLFSPKKQASLAYVNKKPRLHFSWSSVKLIMYYRLLLSSDRNFKKNLRSIKVNFPDYSMELPSGQYYWSVIAYPSLHSLKPMRSKTQFFRIKKVTNFTSPSLERPSQGQKLHLSTLHRGVVFSWNAMGESQKFLFELSTQRNFNKIILKKTTKNKFLHVKTLRKPRNYYWRVRAFWKEKTREKSPYSYIRRFQIIDSVLPFVNENKPIPTYGWEPPVFNLPNSLSRYTLSKYRRYIARLTHRCRRTGPPDALIKKCYPDHLLLRLRRRQNVNLFYFLWLDSDNMNERSSSYTYFKEHCDFRPARELVASRIKKKSIKNSKELESFCK